MMPVKMSPRSLWFNKLSPVTGVGGVSQNLICVNTTNLDWNLNIYTLDPGYQHYKQLL